MIKVEKKERTITDTYTKCFCDICGKEMYVPENNFSSESQIRYVIDYDRYEGGYSDILYFDICNKCMFNKVFPLIKKELKVKPREVKNYW